MAVPIIYGTPFSTYVRTVRMALEEKHAAYELVDVSVLDGEQKQPAHLARNPFGTVPAFEHDGVTLYETSAIARYVDQAFEGAALTPEDPRQRAHMNQIISVIDYHGYRSIILQVVAPVCSGRWCRRMRTRRRSSPPAGRRPSSAWASSSG